VAANTAIFSIATGASRVVGLGREILASSYFATSGAFSAFTIAFQLPNLLRTLVADQAVSAAFVPVFTDLLEARRRRDALELASTLFFVILFGLGALTALFILLAPQLMPLLTGDRFSSELDTLTAGLSSSCSRSSCCSGSTASPSGCSTPMTTSPSARSARWSGTS